MVIHGGIAATAALLSTATLIAGGIALVSRGPSLPNAAVPNVVGLSTTDAQSAMREVVGRSARTVRAAASNEASIGVVIAQDPSAGSVIADDQTVELTVGIRPRPALIEGESLPEDWTSTDPNALAPGDCASWRLEEGLILSPISCDEPHRFQLLGTVSADGPNVFDPDAVSADVEERCDAVFHRVVGAPLAGSSILLHSVYPSEGSWAAGDRVGYCLALVSLEADLVGSAVGSLW